MNPTIRNILAVIAGCIVGGVVNMAIIMANGHIIPLPDGADITTPGGLKASMHLMRPIHFVFPFLAHALGTLVGAYLAALIAAGNKMRVALVIGVLFLAGGISGVVMYPSPMWFNVLDLVVAYIPMAYLGYKLTGKE